jgi:hypothetical protein
MNFVTSIYDRLFRREPVRQQPETQQPERQQPERQQPERQQPERQQPEIQRPFGSYVDRNGYFIRNVPKKEQPKYELSDFLESNKNNPYLMNQTLMKTLNFVPYDDLIIGTKYILFYPGEYIGEALITNKTEDRIEFEDRKINNPQVVNYRTIYQYRTIPQKNYNYKFYQIPNEIFQKNEKASFLMKGGKKKKGKKSKRKRKRSKRKGKNSKRN